MTQGPKSSLQTFQNLTPYESITCIGKRPKSRENNVGLRKTGYQHWMAALEHLLIEKRITTAQQIHALEHAWEAAAARTPHGQPIELSAADTGKLW